MSGVRTGWRLPVGDSCDTVARVLRGLAVLDLAPLAVVRVRDRPRDSAVPGLALPAVLVLEITDGLGSEELEEAAEAGEEARAVGGEAPGEIVGGRRRMIG